MLYFWIALAVISAAVLAGLFVYFNNSTLQVTHYVQNNGDKGVRIVQLSDLHGKSFGRKNSRLIKAVAAEKPSFIVITGDIVHRYRERDKRVALELVSALCAVAPVLFIAGNHEMRNKGYRFFRKDLKEAGAVVLDDEVIEICGVTVAGLNCASSKNGTVKRLAVQDKQRAVLLAHMPHFFESYAEAEFGLVLCGHAHGGQWRIPFTGIGLYAPGQGAFPKLTAGRHTLNKTDMIISRGLGNSQFPLRLFNRPEIVVIDI
ncbi:MAG: metallophosphoesterase [Clostridia bacterium]|nr:metallophosphoesterase [Clostridia bacterium]